MQLEEVSDTEPHLWSYTVTVYVCLKAHSDRMLRPLKFSNDIQVWANSVDLDQRSSLIRIYTVCIFYSMVKPPCSNFRVIIANFTRVRILWIFTVYLS